MAPLESGSMRLQFWACLEPLCPPPEFQVPLTRPHEARHGDTVGFLANAERFRSREDRTDGQADTSSWVEPALTYLC